LLKKVLICFCTKDPYKLIKTGVKEAHQGDPLIPIQKELESIRYVNIPGLPSFTGLSAK
jgi:anthranilate synthase component 1